MSDPLPLSPRQVWALLAAASRELLWGLRAVSREVRAWRELALQIPDEAIRQDALRSLIHKRGHTDGAALFWILPRRRHHDLLRLLVTYELIWDFLDCLNERGASEGTANGRQLHRASSRRSTRRRRSPTTTGFTHGATTAAICDRSSNPVGEAVRRFPATDACVRSSCAKPSARRYWR